MKAVVLAGGLGTRLRKRVPELPKPMAPVGGRPFISYSLDRLVSGGVQSIILAVGYRAESIEAHFGNTYRGAALRYSVETEPLGTGGAIVHALRDEETAPVIILNGDTFLNIDFGALVHWYKQTESRLAMVLRTVKDVARFGSVIVSGGQVVGFSEKGNTGAGLVNAGVYILRSDIFRAFSLPKRFSFEVDILQGHCDELKPRAYVTDSYFIDIGTPKDYERAKRELPSLQ
jgi:D-glycero-alpha-D-manno-heptose 1-phosphate guanylyltransferase